MLFQTVRANPNIRRAAAHRSLQAASVEQDIGHRGLYEEQIWRCPAAADGWPLDRNILISRWVDRRSFRRYEKMVSPSDRHIIAVALETTRLKFARGPRTIFDGIMPAGTLHVTGP